jgi:signal transduction histidine kinase
MDMPEGDDAHGDADTDVARLQARIAMLHQEVEALRQVSGQHEVLVTQLREANQSLVLATVSAQTQHDQAEAANRRQNEFLAMLAHELRNPLAPIAMAATLLERMPDAPLQLRQLQAVIGRQVDQMARLLDDLLDAARISSGKIRLAPKTMLLADLIAQAVETIQPRIAERGQALTVTMPEHPVLLEGDPVRLAQVFSNLLANASKFTRDEGSIDISAWLESGALQVTIQDNGSGIAADVLPHIFDLFTQGPRSLARSEGGLGVGLSVVRNLVAMHGGTVRAHSEGPDCGSCFQVTLPLTTQSRPPATEDGPKPGSTRLCRILLVEDNIDARLTLERLLTLEGHVVGTAANGTDGLAMASSGAYDVLICDIGLPEMDGYDLIRRLRKTAGAGLHAIALSGYGQPEDRARALAAGFDRYLIKPVDGKALLRVLGEVTCDG